MPTLNLMLEGLHFRMSKVIYGSYGHIGEANWLLGSMGFESTGDLSQASLLMIGGGEDIDPLLYTDKPSIKNYGTIGGSRRDKTEVKDFKEHLAKGGKSIGICRGSQLLTALSGGSLIQHVTNHGGRNHDIEYIDGTICSVSSLHHQMSYLGNMPKEDYVVLAKSRVNRSTVYVLDDETVYDNTLPYEGFEEPEIMWFPKTKSLAIQSHPEFMYRSRSEDDIAAMKKFYEIFDLFWNDKLDSYVQQTKAKLNVSRKTA